MTIAESEDTVVVEGKHYFPEASLGKEYTTFSNHRTGCAWKGQAHYMSLFVNVEMGTDLVWFYPEPTEAASEIKGRVAFGRGVQVVEQAATYSSNTAVGRMRGGKALAVLSASEL